MKKDRALFKAVAALIGTVIGAGVLGIPYAVQHVGFPGAIILMITVSVIMVILQLMFAEITLRTPSDHQIPGYSKMYIGPLAKRIAFVVGVIAGYGTLFAYVLGQGAVLSTLFGGSEFMWSVVFLVAGSAVIYRGIRAVMNSELRLTGFIFLVVLIIGVFSVPYLNLDQVMYVNFEDVLIPYGVLVFAFSGIAVIPQIRKKLKGHEKNFTKAILLGNALVFALYAFFTFIVLGVTGVYTTQIATIGLGQAIGRYMIVLGDVLAFFTISTSFITIGMALRRVFQFDYGLKRLHALVLTISVPFILLILQLSSFIQVLTLVGGVLIGIQAIIIILSFWKAGEKGARKPEFALGRLRVVGAALIIIFALGAIATLGVM